MSTTFTIVLIAVLVLLVSGIISGCSSIVKTNYKGGNYKKATVYYYLPESIIKIHATAKVAVIYDDATKTITGSCRLVEQSFTVTTEMMADTKDLLALNYNPNALASDIIKYNVNAKGLLETVDVTAEDRTSAIVAALAQAPQAILTGTAPGGQRGATIAKLKDYSADFTMKAVDITATGNTIAWTLVIPNELGVDEFKTLDAKFTVTTTTPLNATPTVKSVVGTNGNVDKEEINGILTRPLISLPLNITSTGTGLGSALPVYVAVANNANLINVPVTRAAFAKKVNKVTIADGVITGNEITKPSSVEGFISIPVDIAKAIVAIPGQLVTFRYDNTKRLTDLETAKLSYEKALVESQKYSLSKGQELETLKLQIQKTALQNDSDMQKLKLDLQTALLKAQTDQLTAQKALESLQKEIDQLKAAQQYPQH